MKYARFSFSLVVAILASFVLAFPHGRFDASKLPQPPGFTLSPDGFRVRAVGGDKLKFKTSLGKASPVILGSDRALWRFDITTSQPASIDVNLAAPGFGLWFPQGFELHTSTNVSPRLSWSEATVDAPNPTAPSEWILLSFVEKQAPILFVFDKPVQAILTGQSGDWTLSTLEPYSGWVYVRLPLGQYRMESNVEELGAATHILHEQSSYWLAPPARLVWIDSELDETGVTTTWTFDREGAVVPPAAKLASDGGYGVEILSPVVNTLAELDEGPILFSKGKDVKIHFPSHRYASGVPLFVGGTSETDSVFWPSTALRPPWTPANPLDVHVAGEGIDFLSWTNDDGSDERPAWASIAGCRSQDPTIVSIASIIQAGLAARPQLSKYRAERGFPPVEPAAPSSFPELRTILYGSVPAPMAVALDSKVQVESVNPVRVSAIKDGYEVTWKAGAAQQEVAILSPWPVDLDEPVNLGAVVPQRQGDKVKVVLSSIGEGACSVKMKLPPGQSLPVWAPPGAR